MGISFFARWTVALLIVAVAAVGTGCGGDAAVDNSALRERMQYLLNLNEVSWIDFDGGNVYVGFAKRPPDLANVVNSAAVLAHRAHGRTVHLFAVEGGQPGWRPGDGHVMCEASMKMGVPGQVCM